MFIAERPNKEDEYYACPLKTQLRMRSNDTYVKLPSQIEPCFNK